MMTIKRIPKSRVLKLSEETEYLVWQGCAGPIEDWYNGITNMLIENEIADKNYKMTEMYVLDNNGLTCLLTPLDKLNIGKLAMMRLMWRETFGTMWLSDYVNNGYLD